MSLAMARMFVFGFGLELGSMCALALWPDTEHAAIPLAFIGAGAMLSAAFFSTK